MIAQRESAELAEKLPGETCTKQGIEEDQLVLYSDRGSAMWWKSVAYLLEDLGVGKSDTRPHTPMENPESESQFEKMNCQPDYPGQSEGLRRVRGWATGFFHGCNREHRHAGPALMTPAMGHYGQAESVQQ